MRTRSEVLKELTTYLTNTVPKWDGLKNGIIARELLALGSEIIYQTDMLKDSFTSAFDYTTCSLSDLIRLGAIENICITQVSPSTITVKLPEGVGAYKPFSLQTSYGSTAYTNIEPALPNSEVVLYAGTVKKLYNGTEYNLLTESEKSLINYTTVTIDDDVPERYQVLGENINPDSVYVYKDGKLLSRVDFISEYNIEHEGYKLLMNPDGQIAVHFGNGKFAKETDINNYEIYYLDGVFETSQENTSDVDIVLSGVTTPCTVIEVVNGTKSLDAARANYIKMLAHDRILHNAELVKEFLLAYAPIFDCRVLYKSDGCLCVVKPQDENSTSTWPTIAIDLSTYGDIYTKYNLVPGDKVRFKVKVQGDISDELRGQIHDTLSTILDYHKIGIDYMVNCAALQAEVYNVHNVGVTITLVIEEELTPFVSGTKSKLAFVPVPETINVFSQKYGKNDRLIAVDLAGGLYGRDHNYEVMEPYFNWSLGPNGNYGFFSSAIPVYQDYKVFLHGWSTTVTEGDPIPTLRVPNTSVISTSQRVLNGVSSYIPWYDNQNQDYRYICNDLYVNDDDTPTVRDYSLQGSAEEICLQKLKEAFRTQSEREDGTVWDFTEVVCCSADAFVILAATQDVPPFSSSNIEFRIAVFPASDFKIFPGLGFEAYHPLAVATCHGRDLFDNVFSVHRTTYDNCESGVSTEVTDFISPYGVTYSAGGSWNNVWTGMRTLHGPAVTFNGKYLFIANTSGVTRYTIGSSPCNFTIDRNNINAFKYTSSNFRSGELTVSESGSQGYQSIYGITFRGDDIYLYAAQTNQLKRIIFTNNSVATRGSSTVIKTGITPTFDYPNIPSQASYQVLSSSGNGLAIVDVLGHSVDIYPTITSDPITKRFSQTYPTDKYVQELSLPISFSDSALVIQSMVDASDPSVVESATTIKYRLPYACNTQCFHFDMSDLSLDPIVYIAGGNHTIETSLYGEIISKHMYPQIREVGTVNYKTREISFDLNFESSDHVWYEATSSGSLDDRDYLVHNGFDDDYEPIH